ncbi:hypothetical protein M1397_01160 [Candidatus Marsarchaeota archaeon]|nr:hypothetical protein [Candidatus Marsarchaeota archaeon]
MKTIGTFRVKVHSSTDKKKLSTGKTEKYEYGSGAIHRELENLLLDKEVVVKVFEE